MASRQREAGLSLHQALTIAGRMLRTKAFYAVLIVGLGVTGLFARRSKPIFASETVLLYRPGASNSFLQNGDRDESRRTTARLQDMLFERSRLQRLVEEFHLLPDVVASRGLIEAIEEIRRLHLKFDAREGSAIRITFESESAVTAQAVANRAAELVLEGEGSLRKKDADDAKKFLDAEKKRTEEDLHARETELVKFLTLHPDLATESAEGTDGAGAPVRAQRAGEAARGDDGSMLGLEMQALQLRDRIAALNGTTNVATRGEPGVNIVVDTALVAAKSQAERDLAATQKELSDRQAQFTDEYPDVKRAKLAVDGARDKLRRTSEALAAATRKALESAPTRVVPGESSEAASLRKQMALIENRIASSRSRSRPRGERVRDPKEMAQVGTEYSELARKVHEARERQTLLEDKQFQASLQASLASQNDSGDLKVQDRAYLPQRPVRSNRIKIAGAGTVASLLLALALSLVLVLLDDTLHAGFDVERLGLPLLLAEVPRTTERLSQSGDRGAGPGSARNPRGAKPKKN